MLTLAACAAVLGAYALLCAVKPFARCRRCTGTGRIERRGATRTCPRCRGHRFRLRIGRRVHNAGRRTYDDGTR
ncbi:hypothetical protein [Streptomyces soliscabiei]|uniref:hypothetical protein n=1 Tax=Streptomyces soliscabiei TaxID=588897 RepID=UPI0029B1D09D|nr:hypothetical protein [Streptomyces sp. NY05-11A]MDX2675809.1 hypothetical protein [Streptomyces sp. NY05-11A]